MKNWKIVTAITVASIAVALIATVAFASAFNPYRAMTPATGFTGGMMGTYAGTTPNAQSYPYQNGGGGGCGSIRTGYAAPSYTTKPPP